MHLLQICGYICSFGKSCNGINPGTLVLVFETGKPDCMEAAGSDPPTLTAVGSQSPLTAAVTRCAWLVSACTLFMNSKDVHCMSQQQPTKADGKEEPGVLVSALLPTREDVISRGIPDVVQVRVRYSG